MMWSKLTAGGRRRDRVEIAGRTTRWLFGLLVMWMACVGCSKVEQGMARVGINTIDIEHAALVQGDEINAFQIKNVEDEAHTDCTADYEIIHTDGTSSDRTFRIARIEPGDEWEVRLDEPIGDATLYRLRFRCDQGAGEGENVVEPKLREELTDPKELQAALDKFIGLHYVYGACWTQCSALRRRDEDREPCADSCEDQISALPHEERRDFLFNMRVCEVLSFQSETEEEKREWWSFCAGIDWANKKPGDPSYAEVQRAMQDAHSIDYCGSDSDCGSDEKCFLRDCIQWGGGAQQERQREILAEGAQLIMQETLKARGERPSTSVVPSRADIVGKWRLGEDTFLWMNSRGLLKLKHGGSLTCRGTYKLDRDRLMIEYDAGQPQCIGGFGEVMEMPEPDLLLLGISKYRRINSVDSPL